jgi:hypothetical protein
MAQHKKKTSHREERRFTVRGIRRDPPDIRKLSRALIGLAMAEAEREAQAEQAARKKNPKNATDSDASKGGEPNG